MPVADQPTRTDPFLSPEGPRRSPAAPRKTGPRRATGKPRKTAAAIAANSKPRWQGTSEEYPSSDLIDKLGAAFQKGDGSLRRRIINLTIFGSILAVVFAANWASRGLQSPPAVAPAAPVAQVQAPQTTAPALVETPPAVETPSAD